MEKYKEIKTFLGITIDDAVKELLDYKSKGIPMCGKFNNVVLYSDTVTLDEAYKLITGNTKSEFDEIQNKIIQINKEKLMKHGQDIPSLILEWQKKGREILTEDKWEYWDEIVPIRLNDLYQGMELFCSLSIIKILNDGGTLEEAKEIIDSQNHSVMSYSLVSTMVRIFCNRGTEFAEYLKKTSIHK